MIKRIVAVCSASILLLGLTACKKAEVPTPPVLPPQNAENIIIDTSYNVAPHLQKSDTAITLTSPSGSTALTLSAKNGQLTYQVSRNGKIFLHDSAMGLTVDNIVYGAVSSVNNIGAITGQHRTDIRALNGRTAQAKGACIEWTVPVGNMTVDVRTYDNGVAFRYRVNGNGNHALLSEATTFHLPEGSRLWAGTEHVYYETEIKSYPAGIRPLSRLTSPATVELTDGGFAAIVEGDLYNYPGLKLEWKEKNVFAAAFPNAPVDIEGAVTSAWRMIYVANDLNELVNNTMVYLVNDPAAHDYSWVTPGRAAWSWITGRTTDRVTYPLMQTYTDYAAKLGLEYNIIDEGWVSWNNRDTSLRALVDQGKPYGIGQVLWTGMKAGQGYNGTINSLDEAKAYIDYVASLGVVGAKIDFFVTEEHLTMGVNIYEDILAYAAEKKIVINFHGCNKPCGADATYPNELNREAILGLESTNITYTSVQAKMFVTQPFVRNLVGHADYTPACETAFQMAQLVLTDAPMQAIGSDPALLLRSKAVEMFKSVPTVWQETVVLPPSSIGRAAVYARKGNDASWYVGGINYDSSHTDLTLSLSDFLGDGTYRLELWTDQNGSLQCETKTVTRADTVSIPFAKKSGFIIRLDRVTLSQYGGAITPDQPITVTLADSATVVRYTLDGSEPTASSPVITSGAALPITDTCVLTLKITSGPDSGSKRCYRFNKIS